MNEVDAGRDRRHYQKPAEAVEQPQLCRAGMRNASFFKFASSASKWAFTNVARPSSNKTARPHKEPL
jgi:hypothetical protein